MSPRAQLVNTDQQICVLLSDRVKGIIVSCEDCLIAMLMGCVSVHMLEIMLCVLSDVLQCIVSSRTSLLI